jgi:mono/diheme cytochrome c family protein
MNKKSLIILALIVLFIGAASAQDSAAVAGSDSANSTTQQKDVVAAAFAMKCAGCHTIGGGKLTGPDLLPARVWPQNELFTKIKLMEQRVGPLTDGEVNGFVGLLQDARAGERVRIAQELASRAVAATLEPASKSEGRRLFEGEEPFANGGIACVTCHRAGARGGTLGPDLTLLRDRLGKFAMTSAIQQSQYPVMTGTYKDHPVSAQEAVHLAEYLSSPELQPATGMEDRVSLIGVIVGVFALFGIVSLYRRSPYRAAVRTRGNA